MSAVLVTLFLAALLLAGSRLLRAEDRALLAQGPIRLAVVGVVAGVYLVLSVDSSSNPKLLLVPFALIFGSLVPIVVAVFRSQPIDHVTERHLDAALRLPEFLEQIATATPQELAAMHEARFGLPPASRAYATVTRLLEEEFARRGLPVPKYHPRLRDRSA